MLADQLGGRYAAALGHSLLSLIELHRRPAQLRDAVVGLHRQGQRRGQRFILERPRGLARRQAQLAPRLADLQGQRSQQIVRPRQLGGVLDQLDRLVGQEVRLVELVRELGGRRERLVGDGAVVAPLERGLEAAQHLQRLLDGGLGHVDLLQAAPEGAVGLDVLLVLLRGHRGGDRQAAVAQRAFEEVGDLAPVGVQEELVDLVEEQQELVAPVGVGAVEQAGQLHDLLEERDGVLVRAGGEQLVDVEVEQPAPLEALEVQIGGRAGVGALGFLDQGGQALDDGGLADARLAH
ncbi:MAG: hypothetical protein FD126_2640 [Elusimicrobia bacterium]|nr:MAG: hypothetical protein FD126_2640 [Elusimicrobiota bacterium]